MRTIEETYETPNGEVRIVANGGYTFKVLLNGLIALDRVTLSYARKFKDKQWEPRKQGVKDEADSL